MSEARLLRILRVVYQGLMLIAKGFKKEIDDLEREIADTQDNRSL
jgi:hypothetical protein